MNFNLLDSLRSNPRSIPTTTTTALHVVSANSSTSSVHDNGSSSPDEAVSKKDDNEVDQIDVPEDDSKVEKVEGDADEISVDDLPSGSKLKHDEADIIKDDSGDLNECEVKFLETLNIPETDSREVAEDEDEEEPESLESASDDAPASTVADYNTEVNSSDVEQSIDSNNQSSATATSPIQDKSTGKEK
ncbi:unnamed protein product [Ambrosiozyma monospora]|uniref:Unnamed protein product n=1 Tax=Ambrosiozyma monospora TaxID=43982 RepID=A0A9W6T7D8_AMBMO|nr:unnamed protein product [Ambrosiozyma monospora]